MVKRILKRIYNKCRFCKKNIIIKSGVEISIKSNIIGGNKINKNTKIINSKINFGTYIGEDCKIVNTKVGKYCSIANDVKVIVGRHPTTKFVSTHPAFFSTLQQSGFSYVKENKFQEFKYADKKTCKSVIIGNDVWIGSGVLILEGVTIGDGAIIGAGAVVSKDISPYSINVGNPIKEIKKRFNEKEIEYLEKSKWWNKGEEWIKNNIEKFEDINSFIKEKS